MTAPQPDALAQRMQRLFNAHVDAIDGATQAALRARRRAALEALDEPRTTHRWWPAGGMLTAALVLALVVPAAMDEPQPAPSPPAPAVASSLDAAHFAEAATLELENDAAFYAWLAAAPIETDADAGPDTGLQEEGWTL